MCTARTASGLVSKCSQPHSFIPVAFRLTQSASRERTSRPSLVGRCYVCGIVVLHRTPSGSVLDAGNNQSCCPPLRSSQPGGDRHLQAVIPGAFAEGVTGAVGARGRNPTQEATPELMCERFPGQGILPGIFAFQAMETSVHLP